MVEKDYKIVAMSKSGKPAQVFEDIRDARQFLKKRDYIEGLYIVPFMDGGRPFKKGHFYTRARSSEISLVLMDERPTKVVLGPRAAIQSRVHMRNLVQDCSCYDEREETEKGAIQVTDCKVSRETVKRGTMFISGGGLYMFGQDYENKMYAAINLITKRIAYWSVSMDELREHYVKDETFIVTDWELV